MSNATRNPKTYPTYKESGVDWLGSIPKHWNVAPGKAVFSLKKDPNTGMKERTVLSLSYGTIRVRKEEELHGLVPESFETYQVVETGDIICRPTDLQNDWNSLRFGISNNKGIITSAYLCLRTLPMVDRRYAHLLLHTYDLKKIFYGLGSGLRQNLDWDDFKYLPCTLPPPEEQAAIVRYLDDADQRIRAYVRAKERLIALLEEERQAIIHQAVTRGLDSNVKLKPSGVEWLGDVPEHWEIHQLKQKSRIVRGKFAHRPRNDASLYDGPYPFVQTGDIARSGKWITTYEQTLNDRGLAVSQMFPRGTLVMTIAANIGDVAILDLNACFPDSVVGFTPSHNVDRDYLYNLFQSMKTEFLRVAPVNTQGNLNVERIGATIVAFPPLAEQTAIAAHLNRLADGIDAAIDRAHRQIELMEEYRTRLIADVVTGKIDVREIANITTTDEVSQPPKQETRA